MLVIFDLDGTLLNTIQDLSAAVNHALKSCGWPQRTQQECLQFVGNGAAKLLERSLPPGKQTPAEINKLRPFFEKYYNDHLADFTTPYPGMIETLHALVSRGCLLAVASNKYHIATQKIIAHFFPDISFVAVLGQREGVPTKPNPAIVEEILQQAGTLKKQCIYVGDSDVDIQTARNGGVRACGVTWGFRSQETLKALSPEFLIRRPEELLDII